MIYRLGRLPAVHTLHTMRAGIVLASALAPLGKPPEVSDDWVAAVDKVTGGDWGMYMNGPDSKMPAYIPAAGLGDCVAADCAHQVMLHTANAETIIIPTDTEVLGVYEAIGGYRPGHPETDRGCDETNACQYMMTTGIAGQKSAGTAMIDPANLDNIRWAVQLFGSCRLGISVTQHMMSDFDEGAPWRALLGPIEGGHDVPVVKYDQQFCYVVTWGRLQAVSWELMANAQFLSEAHSEIYKDWVRSCGTAPSGLSIDQLLAELPAL